MFPVPQLQIKELIKQIGDRSSQSREQRIQACVELRRMVASKNHVQELNMGWREVVNDLLSYISVRSGSTEVKRNIGSIIGCVGGLMGSMIDEFVKWTTDAVSSTHVKADEERSILIKALSDAVVDSSERGVQITDVVAEDIMRMTTTLLDDNSSHLVHSSLMDLCATMAYLSPTVFKKYFEDVVDCTVGWMVEDGVPSSVHTKCEEVLIGMGSYWLERPQYAIGLMTQFREDIMNDMQELGTEDTSIKDALVRGAALLRAHSVFVKIYVQDVQHWDTVVKSTVVEVLSAVPTYVSTLQYSCSNRSGEFFNALIPLLEVVSDGPHKQSISLVNQCCETVLLIMKSYPHSFPVINGFCGWLTKLHNSVREPEVLLHLIPVLLSSPPSIPSSINGVSSSDHSASSPDPILSLSPPALSTSSSSDSVPSSSPLLLYALSRSRTMLAASNLVSAMMTEKNIKNLQNTYNAVLVLIKDSVSVMKTAYEEKSVRASLSTVQDAECAFIGLLKSLSHVSVVKNSFVVMMGLQPSLFHLLTIELPLTDNWMSEGYAAAHCALVQTALVHCQSHEFFLSNSSWIHSNLSSNRIGLNLTSGHTDAQIVLLTKMLQMKVKWFQTIRSIEDWLLGVLSFVDDRTLDTLMGHPEFVRLKTVLWSVMVKNPRREKRLASLRSRFYCSVCLDDVSAVAQMDECRKQIQVLDKDNARILWKNVPMRNYLRVGVSCSGWDSLEMCQQRVQPARFASEDFAIITHFLLHRQLPSLHQDDNTDDDWMLDTIAQMYAACHSGEGPSDTSRRERLMDRWRWALAQTANYCIENRMRTQYGSPTDTFTEFSKEIHRLAKEAVSGQKVVDGWEKKEKVAALPIRRRDKDTEDDDGIEMKEPRSLSQAEEWWRVRCLLEFFEILEKLIFNAFSGTVYPIAAVSQASRLFFVSNVAACQEWLQRTYISVMAVAYFNGYYAQVVRFGSAAMQEFEKRQQKMEAAAAKTEGTPPPLLPPTQTIAALEWLVKAMVELGDDQSIIGLHSWIRRVYKTELDWLMGCAEVAAGRLESAITVLNLSLKHQDHGENSSTPKFLREMLLSCLSRLRLPDLVNPSFCPPDLSLWGEFTYGDMVPESPPGFDAAAFARTKELCVFGKVDKVDERPLMGWWIGKRMERIEHNLLTTLRRADVADIQLGLARDGCMVLAADGGMRVHTRLAALYHISSCLHSRMMKKGTVEMIETNANILSDLDPSFLIENMDCDVSERLLIGRQMLLWAERLGGQASDGAHLGMAKMARKTGNKMLAGFHLRKAAQNPSLIRGSPVLTQLEVARQGAKMVWSSIPFEQRVQHFANVFSLTMRSYDLDMVQRLNGDSAPSPNSSFNPMAAEFIPGSTIAHGLSSIMTHPVTEGGTATARAAMNMAKWMQENPGLLENMPPFEPNNLWVHLDTASRELCGSYVGAMLSVAAKCAPNVAKAHRKLAEWAVHSANDALPMGERTIFNNNYVILLGAEVATEERLDALWNAVGTSNSAVQLSEKVRLTLIDYPWAADSVLIESPYYTNLWSKILSRRTDLLRLSVGSFFSYIHHLGNSDEHQGSIGTVSATLTIIDLLVRHADIVYEAIDTGLQRTNEHLWKDILPQLFARLSHPKKSVRDSIMGLLNRIGRAAPHAVVFQIVVGASSQMLVEEQQDDVIDEVVGGEEEEKEKKDRSLMFDCCRQLESVLSSEYPRMVEDVREFVNELQRINLLNEERWAFVLANLDHDMEKRMEQIRGETERTLKADHLSEKERLEIVQEKTRLITSSIYRLLDDLYERTCQQDVNTVNERSFIDQYGESIRMAFEQSRANRNSPEKAWTPFRQLLSILMQRTSRRGGHSLQMADISTMLSKLSGSCVPIPGQERLDYSQVVSVDRVGKNALVLPTKTRPKKIALIGNDGKEQIFLFKGQEDLHLDERIMQMLHICNLMLKGSALTRRSWPTYQAHHYAVTPLGTRSGLIQWVSGCTPLFHLYRKWQHRQAAIKAAVDRKNGGTVVAEVERPTDLYMKRLRDAFTAHKVEPEIIADRSKWPAAVMKEVLIQLMKETPKDLLARELWMRAGGGDTWWRVVNRMGRSTAVMSMIGSLLGLGDRHLDNLLVNLDSGHMIHIDYNICFDKGRHLRVPETVPFRLTPNILNAMGPTQADGVFRESSSRVLTVLREGSQTLLTVLDAFVYDPLVDWAAAQDHLVSSAAAVNVAVALAVYGTDSRAVGAKPLARQMFSVRVREFSEPWRKNGGALSCALKDVISVLERQQNRDPLAAWVEDENTIQQNRVEAGRHLKSVIGVHHNMVKNFRPLLRALASCDDRFSAYLRLYREKLSDPLVRGHQMLDGEIADLNGCIQQFSTVLQYINEVYDGLLSLERREVTPVRQSTPQHGPPPGLEDARPIHRQQQEQNAHAKNVSRKVRGRLEGRIDGNDPKRQMTPEEQVDILIRQSTSLSHLSLMYEGWTAWV